MSKLCFAATPALILFGVIVCIKGPSDIQLCVGLNLVVLGAVLATLGHMLRLAATSPKPPT
jgi:Ca2+/Na+ antiporter